MRWIFAFCLILSLHPAQAAWLPSFSLQGRVWNATDIVVASEGERIDGKLRVLEVWRGSLQPQQLISVPVLAQMAPEKERTVSSWGMGSAKPQSIVLDGQRLVLFLRKPARPGGAWHSATFDTVPYEYWEEWCLRTSVVWLQQDRAYAMRQWINPGMPEFTRLYDEATRENRPAPLTEAKLKAAVAEITQARDTVEQAQATKNATQRVQLLAPLTKSRYESVRSVALSNLAHSGPAALTVLRPLLHNEALDYQQAQAVHSFAAAGGAAALPEVLALAREETAFWKKTAPRLPNQWRQGVTYPVAEVARLWRHREKLETALAILVKARYAPARPVAAELLTLWKTQKRLREMEHAEVPKLCRQLLKTKPA